MQKIDSALCPPATSRLQWRIPTEEGVEAKLERERGRRGRQAGAGCLGSGGACRFGARIQRCEIHGKMFSFTGLVDKF